MSAGVEISANASECSFLREVIGNLSLLLASLPPGTLTLLEVVQGRVTSSTIAPGCLCAQLEDGPLLLGAFVHSWRVATPFPLMALDPAGVAGQ